ncbi:hypothetical protein GL58_18770 [Comamonas testosteroni]|uniref:Uncharacterized protein n=1 Tax=Comamonas testosteroni TaxID=285 RepID=A0A0L7MBG7_COMTE|nr:hypothetical protein [Comamonas testosteroni]KOC19250.1 hypothetical protein GL58_18770 [Comamonas testosteroni]KWT72896.1 hypothetical protein APV28_1460 [Comamonas testosteroni]
MTLIPQLPTPPQSTDPANFDPRADAFLLALVPFAEAANQQAAENNQFNLSTIAAAAAAALSASSAKNASDLAVASAVAARWDATATYAQGNLAWSPMSGLIYRRLIAGKTSADPSTDQVNWTEAMNLPVGTGPDQVQAGQHLGQLAYMDALSTTVISRHARDSKPGDIWREYVNDTTTTIKFHGFDGIIRSRSESWT